MRSTAPMKSPGMGHIFLNLNRNKRGVAMNLKDSRAREAVLRLAQGSDVFFHNLRPAVIERLGLSYEDVAAVKPDIIYVSAYGFNKAGPYGARAAYDDVVQGMIGLPCLLAAQTEQSPRYVPTNIVDRVSALNVAIAVNAALVQRERTGIGQHVEVTMFETLAEFVLSDHLGGEVWQPPIASPGYPRLLSPDRRPFQTKDGFMTVLIYNDAQWERFLTDLDCAALLLDEVFASQESRSRHVDEVCQFIAGHLETRTTAEWLDVFERLDIAASQLHSLESLIEDPHLEAIGFFREEDHPTEGTIRVMDVPSRWSRTPPVFRSHAPALGQHSTEVLREAGYSAGEIDRMIADGVVINGAENQALVASVKEM